ncbi:hypothetical protein E2C01_031865 [Portunus trituberculatus]|uniref:Uncharacterized protein n=1 Tax=Portunus trituberculatus TaxID=210409 RepID=A0A5B7EZB3_PORTR|nr:hypothetical protein [Portunus trituberculatus]
MVSSQPTPHPELIQTRTGSEQNYYYQTSLGIHYRFGNVCYLLLKRRDAHDLGCIHCFNTPSTPPTVPQSSSIIYVSH